MLTWEFTGCHRNGNQDAIDVAIVGRLTDLKESEQKRNISSEENNEERSLDTGNGKVFSYRDSSSGSTKDLE
ncbi:hypothetical protein Tco_0789743 [Tanacetum coccineum]